MKQNEINKTVVLKLFFISFFVFIFLLQASLFSQNTTNDKLLILDRIKLNGILVPANLYNDLVISTSDSLTIQYHCQTNNKEQDAIIFRISISNNAEESSFTSNKTSLSYKNLPEGKYSINISAFSPQQNWTSNPIKVIFAVDKEKADLIKKLNKLQDSLKSKEIIQTKSENIFSENNNMLMKILLICTSLIFIFLVYLIIVYLKKVKKLNKSGQGEIMNLKNTLNINKQELEKILIENHNLKSELSSLRAQIDLMQNRGQELARQNFELREHIDKISQSKSDIEELQKQKDDLFAIIIHDIKNPASLIKSLVELLRSYDLNAVEQQEVINDIFETTKKIVTLSQEVTRILSLESSSIKLNLDKVDIRDIIKDVYKRSNVQARNKTIDMMLDLPEKMPEVNLDYQKIDEVLDNLISNAIKFSHKGGKVIISCKIIDENIVVEVSDNGLGLSEEDITNAFQRGQKLSAQPTSGEHSSGFGLWIVKKLIEAHNGRVWLKSALGKGSTFALALPMNLVQKDVA